MHSLLFGGFLREDVVAVVALGERPLDRPADGGPGGRGLTGGGVTPVQRGVLRERMMFHSAAVKHSRHCPLGSEAGACRTDGGGVVTRARPAAECVLSC